jgi:hypothetical protein
MKISDRTGVVVFLAVTALLWVVLVALAADWSGPLPYVPGAEG